MTTKVYPGRLVFVGHYGAYTDDIVYYSDDGGATFNVSSTPLPKMDEAVIAELDNGTLLLNMRNDHVNACACRGISSSQDGGATWSPVTFDPVLIEPVCEASLVNIGGALYFSNPASTTTRANMTVRRTDVGSTAWRDGTLLVGPGDLWGGYSALLPNALPNAGAVGAIVFERSDASAAPGNQTVISFVTFPLAF